MKYIGLLGYPLSHSISPSFQQAALDYYRLEIVYQLWEKSPGELEEAIKKARGDSCYGMNVTIPYKEAVISYLDELDSTAREIRAVNTIVNQKGKLKGYNTDAPGFLKALNQDGGFSPRGRKAAILGCGGAGRAVAFALCWQGIGEILLINRTIEKAQSLKEDLRRFPVKTALAVWNEENLAESLRECDLIVNCTSIGMRNKQEQVTPLVMNQIPEKSLVFDIVYNPPETKLMKEARETGARALGGLSMLVYQGAEAFNLWTELQPPLEIMFRAAREAIRKR